MYSIDDYIRWACEKAELPSSSALSLHLGLSRPAVNSWSKRRTIPSDEVMAKLAKLADENVELALLYLNWWRACSRDEMLAADHYKHMIESFHVEAA